MADIFDKLSIKSDIFDRIYLDKRIIKDLSVAVSKVQEKDIFDQIKLELPKLLKKYVPSDKPKTEITKELIAAIRAEIAKQPPQVIEKVVEKIIEKPAPVVKPVIIDNKKDILKATTEINKSVDEKISEVRKEIKKDDGYRMVIAPVLLPNMAGHVGKYLTVENSVDGLRSKWESIPDPDLTGYVPYTGATGDVDLGNWGLTTLGHGSNANFWLGYDDTKGAGLYSETTGSLVIKASLNVSNPFYAGAYFEYDNLGTVYTAKLGSSSGGGYYTDGTNIVAITNGTYAINATGKINATSTGSFGTTFTGSFGSLVDGLINYAGVISDSGNFLRFFYDGKVFRYNDDVAYMDESGNAVFNDLSLTNPVNIYTLSHNSFANYVADEHIDWTNNTDPTKNFSTVGYGTFHVGGNRETSIGVEDAYGLYTADGTNTVTLADGTYAINATGNSLFTGYVKAGSLEAGLADLSVAGKLYLHGKAGTVPARRGGEILFYHGSDTAAETLKAVIFVNTDGKIVFDTSEQSAVSDSGLLNFDPSDGSASFSSGLASISATGVGYFADDLGVGKVATRRLSVNEDVAATYAAITSSNTGVAGLLLGDQGADYQGRVSYDNNTEYLSFWANGLQKVTIKGATVGMGIGVTVPTVDLELRSIATNQPTRLYIFPNGSPAAGLQSGIKMFGTDFTADATNYNDFGLWAGSDYNYINSKQNGSGVAKDFVFCYNDSNYLGIIKTTGDWGIGTIAPDRRLEINVGAATGGVRLTYNDSTGSAATYSDFLIDSNGDLSITTTGKDISINDNKLTAVMGATQRQGIYIDGATNDFTGVYTASSCYVNEFRRDYNSGTGNIPENIVNIGSYLTIKHTNAEFAASYTYAMNFTVYDTGTHTNTTAVTKTMNQYGMQGVVLPSGTIDATGAGGAIVQRYGISGLISDTTTLKDTGASGTTRYLYNYGLDAQIVSNPTLTSGTWTIINRGLTLNVSGTTTGTSSNYGIYIVQVTGADSNYGLYDASVSTWVKAGGDLYWRTDGSKWRQGAGDDVYLSYTGTYWDFYVAAATSSIRFNQGQLDTDFIVYGDTAEMLTLDAGTLSATFTGRVATKAGTSAGSIAKVGGVIKDHYTDVGSATGSETDIYTYTTPANTLSSDGDKISAVYSINFANNTNNKQIKVYFAGTAVLDSGTLGAAYADQKWRIDVLVIRTGATTARVCASMMGAGGLFGGYVFETDLTSKDWTTTNIIKVTGIAATANNDVLGKLGTVSWSPAA